MDQYLLIPFLGGWTSINPSYFDVHQGYKVLTHCHMFTETAILWNSDSSDRCFCYSSCSYWLSAIVTLSWRGPGDITNAWRSDLLSLPYARQMELYCQECAEEFAFYSFPRIWSVKTVDDMTNTGLFMVSQRWICQVGHQGCLFSNGLHPDSGTMTLRVQRRALTGKKTHFRTVLIQIFELPHPIFIITLSDMLFSLVRKLQTTL